MPTDDVNTPEDESIGCDNLKAFIVSSGLTGDMNADAVAMVTGTCSLDNAPSDPNSCWVDDVSVDSAGNVLTTIPLPLGYSVIDWVAADGYGNLILSTRQKQLVYVAPVVVLNGITDLVLIETPGEGSFKVEGFVQQDGVTISFIGGETKRISDVDVSDMPRTGISCEPVPPSTIDIDIVTSVPSAEGVLYIYSYSYGYRYGCCNMPC